MRPAWEATAGFRGQRLPGSLVDAQSTTSSVKRAAAGRDAVASRGASGSALNPRHELSAEAPPGVSVAPTSRLPPSQPRTREHETPAGPADAGGPRRPVHALERRRGRPWRRGAGCSSALGLAALFSRRRVGRVPRSGPLTSKGNFTPSSYSKTFSLQTQGWLWEPSLEGVVF